MTREDRKCEREREFMAFCKEWVFIIYAFAPLYLLGHIIAFFM